MDQAGISDSSVGEGKHSQVIKPWICANPLSEMSVPARIQRTKLVPPLETIQSVAVDVSSAPNKTLKSLHLSDIPKPGMGQTSAREDKRLHLIEIDQMLQAIISQSIATDHQLLQSG